MTLYCSEPMIELSNALKINKQKILGFKIHLKIISICNKSYFLTINNMVYKVLNNKVFFYVHEHVYIFFSLYITCIRKVHVTLHYYFQSSFTYVNLKTMNCKN